MITFDKEIEKVIVVGVALYDEESTLLSLQELEELAKTAEAQVVGQIVQSRQSIHPKTYVGKGKLDEIKNLAWETMATGIICDDELSPVQMRNLQDELDIKIMDRTLLILDIFARRATTKEGKIQVELAQLKYAQTRLTGKGTQMSRLGGGIGTRGPGEKKLEQDRRLIKARIAQLGQELREIKRHRDITREGRKRNSIPVVAIVGYTNAGKSTLLNALTGADVMAEDKLFATLDPTTRGKILDSGQEILFTDTVGLINKLPHHLVEAFKSTLEEAKYADIILHVVDGVSEEAERHIHTVYSTLMELSIVNKPVITVFNKQDQLEEPVVIKDFKADYCVNISAKTGEGIEKLLDVLEQVLREQKIYIERLFSYDEAGKIAVIRKQGELLSEEYMQEGIKVKAYVPSDIAGKVR